MLSENFYLTLLLLSMESDQPRTSQHIHSAQRRLLDSRSLFNNSFLDSVMCIRDLALMLFSGFY